MINYKHRWFELSRTFIIYYDNCEGGKEVSLLFIVFIISRLFYLWRLWSADRDPSV